MVSQINLNRGNIKDFMLVQSLEKSMRRVNRDIRKFRPKVDKAVKNYNLHIRRMEEMKSLLTAYTNKRDSILATLEVKTDNQETSNT